MGTPTTHPKDTSRPSRLRDFVTRTRAHIKGDETSDAQVFLDHLFQAFAHPGLHAAGATPKWNSRVLSDHLP